MLQALSAGAGQRAGRGRCLRAGRAGLQHHLHHDQDPELLATGEFVSAGAFIGMSAALPGAREAGQLRRPSAAPSARRRRQLLAAGGRARRRWAPSAWLLYVLGVRPFAGRPGHGLGDEHARLRRHPAEHRPGDLGPEAGRRARPRRRRR